jgi:hypothetical protein
MPRVYERKFDWDEAARLRERGMPVRVIAAKFGVSAAAVYLALDPALRARDHVRTAQWQRSGTCPECGSPCTRGYRCRGCANRAQATSVRPAALHCVTCGEWKPDEAFPRDAAKTNVVRRGRHRQCRPCNTEEKRRYRERNRQPCSHGCGTLVDTVDRRDKTKPLECRACANRRIRAERTDKVAA